MKRRVQLLPWETCAECIQNPDGSWQYCGVHAKKHAIIEDMNAALRLYLETGKITKVLRKARQVEASRLRRELVREFPLSIGPCHFMYDSRVRGLEREFLICGRPQRTPKAGREQPLRNLYCEAHFKQERNRVMGSRKPRHPVPISEDAVWVSGTPRVRIDSKLKKESQKSGGIWGVPFEPNWNLGRRDLNHEYD